MITSVSQELLSDDMEMDIHNARDVGAKTHVPLHTEERKHH